MRIIILTISLFISVTLSAQLHTANIFTSHMVLQREKNVSVWGWANKNEKVTIQFDEQTVSAKANAAGKWIVN